jgi:hypothetical protein
MNLSTDGFTRPADTTQYSAGDVMSDAVGTILRFSTADMNEGHVHSGLLIDSSAETTKPEADLFLFDTAPVKVADNSAAAFTDAELTHCVGIVPFIAANFHIGGANGAIQSVNVASNGMTYSAPERILYGVLVARNTYTPVSGEVFTLRVGFNG